LKTPESNKTVRIYHLQELKIEQAEAWRLFGERLELIGGEGNDNMIFHRKNVT